MRIDVNAIIVALLGGLVGLGWLASAQAVDQQWFGQPAFKITTDNGKVIVMNPVDIRKF